MGRGEVKKKNYNLIFFQNFIHKSICIPFEKKHVNLITLGKGMITAPSFACKFVPKGKKLNNV